jgi:hypothetical protein
VISRRALLGTGAGVVALAGAAIYGDHAHKLDDLAGKIGLDPQPQSAESDDALIKTVRHDQTVLLSSTRAAAGKHPGLAKTLAPLIENARKQVAELGGVVADVEIGAPQESATAALASLGALYKKAAVERARNSVEAVSGDFAQVLASISAGLSQSVVVLRHARKALR